MRGKAADLTYRRFGSLVVVKLGDPHIKRGGQRVRKWVCRCDCGSETAVVAGNLTGGTTISCGCSRKRKSVSGSTPRTRRPRMSSVPERGIWVGIKRRCTNPKRSEFSYYGGRGISMCEEWMHSFDAFYRDMGPRPSSAHSIDRINNDGNYEPGNCRWATRSEQQRNSRRDIRLISCNGKSMTLAEWSNHTGLKLEAIRGRLRRRWPIEKALSVQDSSGRG
jgi:hypothetical protein